MIYRNVQAMRGIAAILVVLMHVVPSVSSFYAFYKADAGVLPVLAPFFRPLGLIGVDLFFVISGFVLFLAAHRVCSQIVLDRREAAERFALNRLIRIYPLYWIVFLSTAASSSIPVSGSFTAAVTDLPELFLVDWTNVYRTVPTAWTLTYELYFYAWISLAILLVPRRLTAALFAWIGGHIALITASRLAVLPALPLVTDPILLDFAAGALIGVLVLKGWTPCAHRVLGAAVIFLVAGLYFLSRQDAPGPVDRLPRLLTFGAFAICLIYGTIALERHGRLIGRGLQGLGDASYSIYLWHLPVFWTLNWAGVLSGFYSFEHPYMTVLIWFAVALLVGFLSYRWIEQPILAVIRRNRPAQIVEQPA